MIDLLTTKLLWFDYDDTKKLITITFSFLGLSRQDVLPENSLFLLPDFERIELRFFTYV